MSISTITRYYIKALLLFALLSPMAYAVPVAPILQPRVTFVNASGGPCAGCKLSSFAAGTTTPLATYTDSSGISVNTNPITLDASGGAFIWLGNSSYKFILKDPLGATIWTVDMVPGGGGIGGICGPAGAIQIANGAVNGLTCDASITINTTNHTVNVGTLPASHVTIVALGTPTSWNFDTTTPDTARLSLNAGQVGAGAINQIAVYAAAGTSIAGASALPAGVTVITQAPGDNSLNPASTAYVALPGPINPTTLSIAAGTAMTGNQGSGLLIQHSTGTATPGDVVVFDATGNTTDGGPAPVSITGVLTFTTAQGPLASNTCQPFTVTMSASIPAGYVVVGSIAQGQTFAGTVGGVRFNITAISGDLVTVNFCNDWNSNQGWGPTVMNFTARP